MAKGQKKSNKEVRKPKASKVAAQADPNAQTFANLKRVQDAAGGGRGQK